MQHDDSHPAPRAQQLVGFGILALLMMTIVGSTIGGAAGMVGTFVLAIVCLTCFALALRASQRGPK